jgi:hypothetical protein
MQNDIRELEIFVGKAEGNYEISKQGQKALRAI